jgi:hypothetical protein
MPHLKPIFHPAVECGRALGTLFRIAVRNVARNRRRTLITMAPSSWVWA